MKKFVKVYRDSICGKYRYTELIMNSDDFNKEMDRYDNYLDKFMDDLPTFSKIPEVEGIVWQNVRRIVYFNADDK